MNLFRRLRDLTLTVTVFGGGVAGYLYYRTRKNLKEHIENM